MASKPQVNLVIPLFNEEQVYPELVKRLTDVLDKTSLEASVIMIDDGSTDQTATLMRETSGSDPRFTSVFLSRNFGHQLALTAGLSRVNASEAVFILDGDLQDPPELLEEFYSYLGKGYDVVYAVRKKRKENIFNRLAYKCFYMVMKKISYLDMPLDSGDFSLISRRAVDHLNEMTEESRFLRGMRAWIGYKQIGITYERPGRHSGESKYTFKRLLGLAFNGLFNFSELPVRFITRLGLLTFIVSFIYLLVTLFKRFVLNEVPEGFTATLITIILFGSVQLISIGILGEYILRIFFQAKGRPLFIVKEVLNDDNENK